MGQRVWTVAKTLISLTELQAKFDAAMSAEPACDGSAAPAIYLADSEYANWSCDLDQSWNGDCKRAFIAIKFSLQRDHDVMTDS